MADTITADAAAARDVRGRFMRTFGSRQKSEMVTQLHHFRGEVIEVIDKLGRSLAEAISIMLPEICDNLGMRNAAEEVLATVQGSICTARDKLGAMRREVVS